MQLKKLNLYVISLGLLVWLTDLWGWLISDTPIGITNIVGVSMILIGSIGMVPLLRSASSRLMFLGSLLWLIGNLAIWRGADEILSGVSMFGEALFFLSLAVVGISISTGGIKKGWVATLAITIFGITLRIISLINGNNPFEMFPTKTGIALTLYTVLLLFLIFLRPAEEH